MSPEVNLPLSKEERKKVKTRILTDTPQKMEMAHKKKIKKAEQEKKKKERRKGPLNLQIKPKPRTKQACTIAQKKASPPRWPGEDT